MNRWNPCRRSLFITKIRALGFVGPYSGAKHQFMLFGAARLTIPSNDEYSVPQLRTMVKEVEAIIGREISTTEWNRL